MSVSVLILTMLMTYESHAQSTGDNNSPWRRSDQVLLQLCFDRLDAEPPKNIRVQTISDTSVVSSYLELVGRTLTGRPIYQGSVGHPTRAKFLMYQLPDTKTLAQIEIPADLPTRIDLWKGVKTSFCTANEGAAIDLVNERAISKIACPDVGTQASIKVAASAENALLMRDVRERGPSTFNGLKGCNEPAYPIAK